LAAVRRHEKAGGKLYDLKVPALTVLPVPDDVNVHSRM